MPANRESSETIEIGRDYEYGPSYSDPKPLRRSSTSRSDDWGYHDSTPGRRDYYDEYMPRRRGPDVYDRPSRPDSYQDNFYSDRWQRNLDLATHRRGAQDQAVSLRERERSPSPVGYDDGRIAIADRSRRFASEITPRHEPAAPPKRRRNSEPAPGLFQTVFDVNHPQDTSVYLELPITDDYETELEEFCRLQRLGNFGAAEEYFRNNLEQHLSNPYVFVQYGQMLLEKGDYLAFEQLDAEAVFGQEVTSRPPPRKETVEAGRSPSPPPRVRSWSPTRERRRETERLRGMERRRETKARPRSRSPVENGRHERHARFESDVGMVRRSRSPSIDRSRDWYYRNGHDRDEETYRYGLDRDDERYRGWSSDTTAQFRETLAESGYDELQLLRQNWTLMKSVCDIHSEGNHEEALIETCYTVHKFPFGARIGSTEIQLVKLALQLCGHIQRVDPELYTSVLDGAAKSWIEWPALFKELLVQGRIWDFKDLYVAHLAAFSDPEATPHFGTEDYKRSLIDDWISEDSQGDESTNLALLEIILEPNQLRPVFLDETKSRVEAIMTHCPAAMKSRSFIRWILASAADALTGDWEGEGGLWLRYRKLTNGLVGLVWHRRGHFSPGIYIPPNTQNPGWVAPEHSLAVKEPIQLALNLAKELKDYKSQAACLKLLICESADPTQLFQDLASLQKSIQGDKEGHLETLLSSYLVCKDRLSKERLLGELQQTDDWRDDESRDGLLYWCRDFIERALKRSLQGPKGTAKLRNTPNFYMGKGLPKEVEQFTLQHTEQLDFPHVPVHPPYPPRRHETAISSRSPNQTDGRQVIRPHPRPSTPYERPSSRQSPYNASHNGSFDRRDRDELEAAQRESRIELEQFREDEARERRDREMRFRLADAEQRGRRLEEINKTQAEEMEKKSAEIEKLQHEYKLEKEKQDRETRARQDQDTRERLERLESSWRDQAEVFRRAGDRSYQKWVTGRDKKLREKTSGGKSRSRRRNTSIETASMMSSDTCSSDSSRSSYYEDSDDDSQPRTLAKNNNTTSSDRGDEPDPEPRDDGERHRNIKDIRSEPSTDEADQQDGDDPGSLQQNPCTDLVLYEGQVPTSPQAYVAGSRSPLARSPASPLHGQEDVDGGANSRRAKTVRRTSKTSRATTKSSRSKGSRHRARRQSKQRDREIEEKLEKFEEKYRAALKYAESVDEPTGSLAADMLQRANKTSSRSTRVPESKGKSGYKPPAASRDSVDHSVAPEDVTLFVKGSGILSIGNAQLGIKDGEQLEITIHTHGSEKDSRGSNERILSDTDQQRVMRTGQGIALAKEQLAAQQFRSSSPPPGRHVPSPCLMSDGQSNMPAGWEREQSQLQQPIFPPRHREIPSISSLKQQNQANARFQSEEGFLENFDPTNSIDPNTGAVPTSSTTVQPLQGEELDDSHRSVQSIGVEERETSGLRQSRREREELDDLDHRARRRDRLDRDRQPSLDIPSRRSTGMTEEEREGIEARGDRSRNPLVQSPSNAVWRCGVMLMLKQKPAIESTQTLNHEKAGNLTQEPQAIYELDQASPDAMRYNNAHGGPPRQHIHESQTRDELSSKQQNERIASRPSNRPSRPSSVGIYGSPRPYVYDSTSGYDVWKEDKGRRTPRSSGRVLVEPPPSNPNTPRASARARSRPSSTQELDDIRPISRRTSSRLDYFPPPPPPPPAAERLQSPTKRQSIIFDADGRPHPIRTKSENIRSRPGDAGSAPRIVVRRGVSADGRRPRPEMPAPVAGARSRPQSVTDPITRHHNPGPDHPIIERLPAENWEKETEGVWRKKKGVSTVPEDPEEEAKLSPPQPQRNDGEGPRAQTLLDPEQGISRKSTVTDPEPEDE